MNQKIKTDLRYEFEEIIIPALALRQDQETHLLNYLRELDAKDFELPMDRCIDSTYEAIRLYSNRIQACKKYVSELKD